MGENQGSVVLNIPENTYRCGRGHTLKLSYPFSVQVKAPGVDFDTGPLCPVCVQQELARKFGTSEVEGCGESQGGPVGEG
jgi:hypothetical protein